MPAGSRKDCCRVHARVNGAGCSVLSRRNVPRGGFRRKTSGAVGKTVGAIEKTNGAVGKTEAGFVHKTKVESIAFDKWISNCCIIENIPPKGVILADFICILAMSHEDLLAFICNTKLVNLLLWQSTLQYIINQYFNCFFVLKSVAELRDYYGRQIYCINNRKY